MLLFAGNPETDVAGGSLPADDGSPPMTTAESDRVTDSEAAVLWNELVGQALADAGIDLEVTRSYETKTSVADGGSVTAAIDDSDGQLVFVADLQAWAEAEYQSDPEWQAEVAGSSEPGSTVPEGTLFVLDERQTTATTIQTIILVSEDGLLTIKAEETPSVPLLDVGTLESVTRSLGGDIGELTQSNASASEPSRTQGSPVVGLDESYIDAATADGSVTPDEMSGAYEAFFGCLAANGGSGEYAFNLDYGTNLSYDVGIQGVSDSAVVEKIVDACRSSYVGGLPSLFNDQHTPSDADLQRQLESIRACVANIDPALGEQAAEIDEPDAIHQLADDSDHGVEIVNCVNSNGEGFTTFG